LGYEIVEEAVHRYFVSVPLEAIVFISVVRVILAGLGIE
jgi:hypothetical protein